MHLLLFCVTAILFLWHFKYFFPVRLEESLERFNCPSVDQAMLLNSAMKVVRFHAECRASLFLVLYSEVGGVLDHVTCSVYCSVKCWTT